MYRGQRRVTGQNIHITFPTLKDLSYDKNAPLPKADTAPAAATPAPAPSPAP
jgi:hypothetical protein